MQSWQMKMIKAQQRQVKWGAAQQIQGQQAQWSAHSMWEVDVPDSHASGGVEWDHQKPTKTPDVMGCIEGFRQWKWPVILTRDTHRFRSGRDIHFRYSSEIIAHSGVHLRSIAMRDSVWVPGRVMQAQCMDGRAPHHAPYHQAPDPRCDCGLWGIYDTRWLPLEIGKWTRDDSGMIRQAHRSREAEVELTITGRITGWGVVVEGDNGFRAEYAEVTALYYYPDKIVKNLEVGEEDLRKLMIGVAKNYNVPLIWASPLSATTTPVWLPEEVDDAEKTD